VWILLFVQANYGLKDYESALADFGSVLQIDPENKAARQQLVIASNKVREQRQRERQAYAGMFDKLAKIDTQKVNQLSSFTTTFIELWCLIWMTCTQEAGTRQPTNQTVQCVLKVSDVLRELASNFWLKKSGQVSGTSIWYHIRFLSVCHAYKCMLNVFSVYSVITV